MKSCASSQERLKTAEGQSREYEARSKAGKTDPKALQRERLAFYEGVRRLEEKFSSSGSSTPQPTTSGQPLIAGTQARSR